jgi:hypothetical protein
MLESGDGNHVLTFSIRNFTWVGDVMCGASCSIITIFFFSGKMALALIQLLLLCIKSESLSTDLYHIWRDSRQMISVLFAIRKATHLVSRPYPRTAIRSVCWSGI